MIQHKAYKFRIYPTKQQEQFFAQQFGQVRFVYNWLLANRKNQHKETGKGSTYAKDAKLLTKLRNGDEFPWLKEGIAQSQQASVRNLDTSHKKFYKKETNAPKFKKKSNRQSLKLPQNFELTRNRLQIPKLKQAIKVVIDRPIEGRIVSCTISKTPSGKYYASFACEVDIDPKPELDTVVGLDLGLKTMVVTSDDQQITNPQYYRNNEKKLKYLNRQLSKKQKGSNNRNKARLRYAKAHEHVTNKRIHNLHEETSKIVNENQVIIVEDLNVKGMIKNHKLAKSIQDVSWGELLRQLEYKSKWYGRTFHKINRFFPSSKTCNGCSFVLGTLPLATREWQCPSCNQINDRDLNAAKNIRDQGILELKNLARATSPSGCGMQSDVKQKLAEALCSSGESLNQDTNRSSF